MQSAPTADNRTWGVDPLLPTLYDGLDRLRQVKSANQWGLASYTYDLNRPDFPRHLQSIVLDYVAGINKRKSAEGLKAEVAKPVRCHSPPGSFLRWRDCPCIQCAHRSDP